MTGNPTAILGSAVRTPVFDPGRAAISIGLLLFCSIAPANSAWDTCSGERTVRIFTLNDYLNASWTVNTDDYRSFGFGAWYDCKKSWSVSAEYFGLTNREETATGNGARADELTITVHRRYRYLFGYQRIDLAPELGMLLSGNLGSHRLQNLFHRATGFPSLDETYSRKTAPTAAAGGRIGYSFVDRLFDKTEFALRTDGRIIIRPLYDARLEIGESTYLLGPSGDLFLLEIFNRYVGTVVRDRAVARVAAVETGWSLRYVIQCGGFYISNEFCLMSGFATGALGFAFPLRKQIHHFLEETFIFEGGIIPALYGWRAQLRAHPWTDGRFTLKADYVCLDPDDIEFPTFRTNRQQIVLGADASLLPVRQKTGVSPFASAGIGIIRAMRFSNIIDTTVVHFESPVATGEIGLRISGTIPWTLLPSNVIYGISISDLYSLPLKEYRGRSEKGIIEYITRCNCFPFSVVMAVDF